MGASVPAALTDGRTQRRPPDHHAFTKGPRSGADLAYLLQLMQQGQLQVDIGWRGSWTRIAEAAGALFGRQVTAQAVLDID